MPCNQACQIHTWLEIELVKLMPNLQISTISHSQDHTQDTQGSFKTRKVQKIILPFKSNVAHTVHAYPHKYCHLSFTVRRRCPSSLPIVTARCRRPLSLPVVTARCRCTSSLSAVAACCCCSSSLPAVAVQHGCPPGLRVVARHGCTSWLPRHGCISWLRCHGCISWLRRPGCTSWLPAITAHRRCLLTLPAIAVCCCWPSLLSVMRPLEVLRLKRGASALRRLVNRMPSCLPW